MAITDFKLIPITNVENPIEVTDKIRQGWQPYGEVKTLMKRHEKGGLVQLFYLPMVFEGSNVPPPQEPDAQQAVEQEKQLTPND